MGKRWNWVGLIVFAPVVALVFAASLAAGLAAANASPHPAPIASAPASPAGDHPTRAVEAAQEMSVWRRALAGNGAGILTVGGSPGGASAGKTPLDGARTPVQSAMFAKIPRRFVVHVPILMYHLVVPWRKAGQALAGLVVPPETFDAQMRTLARAGWHSITAASLATYLGAGLRPPPRSFVITFDDGWSDGYRYAFPIMRRYRFVGTFYVVTGRIGHTNALSVAQLRALAAAGMEVGDHTVSHADVPALSASRARSEIVRSALQIKNVMGAAPVTFAYPYGARNARDEHLVEQAGFGLAVTTVYACRESAADQFAIPRLRVGPGTTPSELLRSMENCWALDR
jgi:peptidoglycan/xylan/chitin deacetylase (PgdA/CDA1 family)